MNLKIQENFPENNLHLSVTLKKKMYFDPAISTVGNTNVYKQRSSLKDVHQCIINNKTLETI